MGEPPLAVKDFFKRLNKETIYLVDEFYDDEACFRDPLGEHRGVEDIKNYYARLYHNVTSIDFHFLDELAENESRVLIWKMTLRSKLNARRPTYLDGVSYFKFGGKENKAVYHRDYFDMGEFVYETIPVLKQIVQFIKRQLRGHEEGEAT